MNEFQKRDPNQFGTGGDEPDDRGVVTHADRAPDPVDVVEGEVGSARLKEPSEVEANSPQQGGA